MNIKDFNAVVERVIEQIRTVLITKGKDYTSSAKDADRLVNFKEIAKSSGITPQQAAMVLATKHWLSINQHYRGQKCTTEAVLQRKIDLINYIIFTEALDEELL